MPRRASSGIGAGQVIGLIVGIVFIIGFVVVLFWLIGSNGAGGKNGEPRTASRDLVALEYYSNANSLRGNAYNLEGKVTDRLGWTADRGRLIYVEDSKSSDPIPILIPPDFDHVNIESGANFKFVVEVGDRGILTATSID